MGALLPTKLLRAYMAGNLLLVKMEKVPPLPEDIIQVLEALHARALSQGSRKQEDAPPTNPLLSWLRRPR